MLSEFTVGLWPQQILETFTRSSCSSQTLLYTSPNQPVCAISSLNTKTHNLLLRCPTICPLNLQVSHVAGRATTDVSTDRIAYWAIRSIETSETPHQTHHQPPEHVHLQQNRSAKPKFPPFPASCSIHRFSTTQFVLPVGRSQRFILCSGFFCTTLP